ncbi:MAG: RHS repeat protein, partial [Chlamydiae bacterium]|nr:RHS repeat protein [Chlamydiota bacterium]
MRYRLLIFVWVFCCFLQAIAKDNSVSSLYLGSREGDPAGLVENVSVVHGDYTEVEVDLTVAAPDSLVLSRFYSSRDSLHTANFGGWRFNPHCFLSIQKDPKGKSYMGAEGKFEKTYVYVGNPDGTILTYVGWQNPSKKTLFKMDPERGITNTAKATISSWTNFKNNELYFDPQTSSFELYLSSEGKRFYRQHPFLNTYFITQEILPSGNKIFYDFDEKGQLTFIKETNSSEKKVLAWIKIEYGQDIHIETSDGKSAEYHFIQETSGVRLLSEVMRSHKPCLSYKYQVVGDQALLIRKSLPEGRFVHIDYHTDDKQKNKVRSVTTPFGEGGAASVLFSYEDGYTEVDGREKRKTIYRFDEDDRLIAVEQHLDGAPYRIHKKSWGKKSDAGNLISTSVEDARGDVFYYKHFTYDDRANIACESEYGDVIGLGAIALNIDEEGFVTNQDGHIKNYTYFSGKNTHGFFQTDAKGTGVKYWYKKGTQLLIKKFILQHGSSDKQGNNARAKKRYFYEYNEDAVLTKVVVDDGGATGYWHGKYIPVPVEGHITLITPKQELPGVGTPEIIEERYFKLEDDPVRKYMATKSKKEMLFKKVVNRFDAEGNVVAQAVYDANGKLAYTLTKGYVNGLLTFETDPVGHKTQYSYDGNHNRIYETFSHTGGAIEYGYDLQNRLVCTTEKDKAGNLFKTQLSYDTAGNKVFERDRYGNETHYINDDLGRPLRITYPHASIKATYGYTYDLFDNPVSVTDPKGRILTRSYTVQGNPIEIQYLDGTKEVFKYDSGGN